MSMQEQCSTQSVVGNRPGNDEDSGIKIFQSSSGLKIGFAYPKTGRPFLNWTSKLSKYRSIKMCIFL